MRRTSPWCACYRDNRMRCEQLENVLELTENEAPEDPPAASDNCANPIEGGVERNTV
jgi:hypothetical protein